jgi:hypothetical protein
LIANAYDNSLSKVKDKGQIRNGLTITKSISDKKRTLKKRPAKSTKGTATKREDKEKEMNLGNKNKTREIL